jgi:pimeloyl-ACP methyl ester carboxylesterase
MPTIHCISGLGADQRVFSKLQIPGWELKTVPWPHIDAHDEMACYAQKVAALIPDGPEHVILGLSFGGMLASEIARVRPDQNVIIVSSAKHPDELGEVSGWLKFLVTKRLFPVGLMRIPNKTILRRFGAYDSESQILLRNILDDSDNHLVSCAGKAIMEWKTTPAPPQIVHIHGTADQIIKPDLIKPTHWVRGGEHMMIYTRAQELGVLIGEHL